MKPQISQTSFGYIVAGDEKITHDIIIRLSGKIEKRKKKLSKAEFGTSHIISLREAEYDYEDGAEVLIIGTGHDNMVTLSEEAAEFFRRKNCRVDPAPTPRAAELWNRTRQKAIGLFHVTC